MDYGRLRWAIVNHENISSCTISCWTLSPKMCSLYPESPDLKTRYSVKDELAQIRFENIQCAFHPRTQCLWSSDVLLGDYLLRLSNTERLLLILQRIYSVGGFCTKTSKKSRMRIYASVRICPWVPLTNPKLCLSGPRCTYCWFTFTFQANSSRRADQHPLKRAWWGNNRHWQVESRNIQKKNNFVIKLFNSATPTLERNPG